MSVHRRYCSWCGLLGSHGLSEQNYLRRNVYSCSSCHQKTLECRIPGCTHMTKAGENWDDEFCAVHDGSIASFASLTQILGGPEEWPALLRDREGTNFLRVGKTVAFVAGGVVLLVPLAAFAAPAIGAAIGAATGLSGAAATSAGLAILGGGSLAAGGLGMAGGALVVSAVGGAAGGALGGFLSNAYMRDVEGFDIVKVRDGIDPALILIDGFLTQGNANPHRWLAGLNGKYADRAVYHVQWESQTLGELGTLLGSKTQREVLKRLIIEAAKKGTKRAGGLIGPLTLPFDIASLAKNPWTIALLKAEQTGELLKEAIIRSHGRSFILMGHSLGARVAYSALSTIGTIPQAERRGRVVGAHLFGGAVGTGNPRAWERAAKAVSRAIHSYRSSKDDILRYAYPVGTVFTNDPIGRHEIQTNKKTAKKIINFDATDKVGGHMVYHENLYSILRDF